MLSNDKVERENNARVLEEIAQSWKSNMDIKQGISKLSFREVMYCIELYPNSGYNQALDNGADDTYIVEKSIQDLVHKLNDERVPNYADSQHRIKYLTDERENDYLFFIYNCKDGWYQDTDNRVMRYILEDKYKAIIRKEFDNFIEMIVSDLCSSFKDTSTTLSIKEFQQQLDNIKCEYPSDVSKLMDIVSPNISRFKDRKIRIWYSSQVHNNQVMRVDLNAYGYLRG